MAHLAQQSALESQAPEPPQASPSPQFDAASHQRLFGNLRSEDLWAAPINVRNVGWVKAAAAADPPIPRDVRSERTADSAHTLTRRVFNTVRELLRGAAAQWRFFRDALFGPDPMLRPRRRAVITNRVQQLEVRYVLSSIGVAPTIPTAAEFHQTAQQAQAGELTITRTGDLMDSVEVAYTLTGSATNGTDYHDGTSMPVAGSVWFMMGESSKTIAIHPLSDNTIEGAETVLLTLQSVSGYDLDPNASSATITIADAPLPTVSITATDADASEFPAPGQPDNPGELTITRTGDLSQALTVHLAYIGTATNGSDVHDGTSLPLTTTVEFQMGESTRTLPVRALSDGLIETDESFVVSIASDSTYTIDSSYGAATVTIHDAPVPTVSIAVTDSDAALHDPATGMANPGEFTITRTGDLSLPLTVQLAFSGTLQNGTDYGDATLLPLPTVIEFLPGIATHAILIQPYGEWQIEGPGAVTIAIDAGAGYTVVPNSGTATIAVAEIPADPNGMENRPQAVADGYRAVVGHPLLINILANDGNTDGVTVQIVSQPANGQLEQQGTGQYRYVPNAGYVGFDSFSYRLVDDEQRTSDTVEVSLSVIDPVALHDTDLLALATSGLPFDVGGPAAPAFGATTFGGFHDLTANAEVAAAIAQVNQTRSDALAAWQTAEQTAWTTLETARTNAANALAQSVQGAMDTADLSVADALIAAADGILHDLDGEGGFVETVGNAFEQYATALASIVADDPDVEQENAVRVDRSSLAALRDSISAANLKLEREIARAGQQRTLAASRAEAAYDAAVGPAVSQYARQSLAAYGRYLLDVTSAYISQKTAAVRAERAFDSAVAGLKTEWDDSVRGAQNAYRASLIEARDAFDQAADEAANRARDAIRAAFADYAQAEAQHREGSLDDEDLACARDDLSDACRAAREQNLDAAIAAAHDFVDAESTALEMMACEIQSAGHQYATQLSAAAKSFRDSMVAAWQTYLTQLNNASSTRDTTLNTALTSLTSKVITAEAAYSQAMISAAQQHDQKVVAANAARDQALLGAVETFLSTPATSSQPSFTAAEAQSIRTAVARMSSVVSATSSVLSQTISASATFLGQLVSHGSTLATAVNQADGTLTAAIISAETTGLNAACTARANYEFAINTADHNYAIALAGASESALTTILDALTQTKHDAVDGLADQDFNSLQYDPQPGNGELAAMGNWVDRYRINIDSVLMAIDMWNAAHPQVENPSAEAELPIDLGLPSETPAWMALFEEAFSSLPADENGSGSGTGGGEGGSQGGEGQNENGSGSGGTSGEGNGTNDPAPPAWVSRLDDLTSRAENQPSNSSGTPTPTEGLPPQENPPPQEISETEWTRVDYGGVYIGSYPQGSDQVIRVVDGKAFAVPMSEISALPNKDRMTVADWDYFFVCRGEHVTLTPESLNGLRNNLGERLATLTSETPTDANAPERLTLGNQQERLNAMAAGDRETITSDDLCSYSDLVAHTKSILGESVGQSFIDQFGLAGMWRLYLVTTQGGWTLTVGDLSVYCPPTSSQTSGYYAGPGSDSSSYLSQYRYRILQTEADPRRIAVNDRLVSSERFADHPAAETTDEIARRAYDAIHDPLVTIDGGNFTAESTAAAAWQAFCEHPNTAGTIRITLGTVQLVGGFITIAGTGGFFAVPGGYDVMRGADEIITGIWTVGSQNAATRSFAQAALDRETGDQAQSDRILLGTDLTMGALSLGGLVRNSAQAGKLAALETRAAIGARAGGQVTGEVASATRSTVQHASEGALRAIEPNAVLPSATRYRGEPFAFGAGPRNARVNALLDEASRASGVTLSDLVDEVRYVKGSSSFDIVNGRRVLSIGSDAFGRSMAGQLIEGAHEIGHAQVFDRLVRTHGFAAAEQEYFGLHRNFGTPLYAREEMLVERLARWRVRRHLGGLSPQQEAASTRYIRDWHSVWNGTP